MQFHSRTQREPDEHVVEQPTSPPSRMRGKPPKAGFRGRFGPATAQGAYVRWLSIAAFTCICVLLPLHTFYIIMLSEQAAIATGVAPGHTSAADIAGRRTLSFAVCNGMPNQRLALVYGVLMALELGRVPVLPSLLSSVTRLQGEEEAEPASPQETPMSQLYDTQHLILALGGLGIEVLEHSAMESIQSTYASIDHVKDPVQELFTRAHAVDHLVVGCPLFKLGSYYFSPTNTRIMWALLTALTPSRDVARSAKGLRKYLSGISGMPGGGVYNFLHLRLEKDWVEHCSFWEAQGTKEKPNNNCMNNTDTVQEVLLSLDIPTTDPLFVSCDWGNVDLDVSQAILLKLADAGYRVVTSQDMQPFFGQNREQNTLIEFEVARGAAKFVGNSVSTFSALLIYERAHTGRSAAFYNGGGVPLSDYIPTPLLPWVFAHSAYAPELDVMVEVAIKSANNFNTLKPYCLWQGNTSLPMYKLMVELGVTVIDHMPEWAEVMWTGASNHQQQNLQTSQIFRSKEIFISNMCLVDVPILEELKEASYVLVTLPEVFFLRPLSLHSFTSLPEYVGVPRSDTQNLGISKNVLLLNLLEIRPQFDELMMTMTNNRHGGMFSHGGHGFMGVYLEHFWENIPIDLIPSRFGGEPRSAYDPGAFLLHFPGPKIPDYVKYFWSLECPWGAECEAGFHASLCSHMKEWQSYLDYDENDVGLTMWYACLALYAPHLKGFVRHRLLGTA